MEQGADVIAGRVGERAVVRKAEPFLGSKLQESATNFPAFWNDGAQVLELKRKPLAQKQSQG
jgi:hypothetical protein